MKVGDKIKMPPWSIIETTNSDAWNTLKDKEGTIVYVNYAHRYFTVEYEFKYGRKFRESFKMMPPQTTLKKVGKYG